MMTWPSRNLYTRIPAQIKDIFYSHHLRDKEIHSCDVCVHRVLCQAASSSSKHGLKNSTKLQPKKKKKKEVVANKKSSTRSSPIGDWS